MKKLILIFVIILIGYNSLRAQSANFGITAGLLVTDTKLKLDAAGFSLFSLDNLNNTGFNVGVLVDIEASDRFHIQPELTYGQAGDLGFVYLPVMFKLYVGDRFHFQLGPQLSFSTNTDDIKKSIQDIQEIIGSGNVDDVLKTTGFDIGVGLGFDVSDNFLIQTRYAIPLTNVYNGPLNDSFKIKTGAFLFGLAYLFD